MRPSFNGENQFSIHMNIEITSEEMSDLKSLREEYLECPQDGSYLHHLMWGALQLLIDKGVIGILEAD